MTIQRLNCLMSAWYHVIPLQEAESRFRDNGTMPHIYQGADQLIMFDNSTFEPGEEVILVTSKLDSFGL